MNKTEIVEKLGISQRKLERLDMRCREAGLLDEPRYKPSATGGQERDFSRHDVRVLSKALSENGSLRAGQDHTLTGDEQKGGVPMVRPGGSYAGIQLLADALANAGKPALGFWDGETVMRLDELPITRHAAIKAHKAGKLRLIRNELGRGYRVRRSDWLKYLANL
jgi:hypothetical protein